MGVEQENRMNAPAFAILEATGAKGETLFGAFIPGRGTIYSSDINKVRKVVSENASESSIADALGFTTSTPVDANKVVQAIDKDGNVISEQLVNAATEQEAIARAVELSPINDYRVKDPEDALADRADLLVKEEAPAATVRNVDDDYDANVDDQPFADEQVNEEQGTDRTIEPETFVYNDKSYAPLKTQGVDLKTGKVFDDLQQDRDAFDQKFPGVGRWDDPRSEWSLASRAVINNYIAAKELYGNEASVDLTRDGDKLSIVVTPESDVELIQLYDPNGRLTRVTPKQFLGQAITQARKPSKDARNVLVIDKNGRESIVSLNSLVRSGEALMKSRAQSQEDLFTGDNMAVNARRALASILAELQIAEYDIRVGEQVPIKTKDGIDTFRPAQGLTVENTTSLFQAEEGYVADPNTPRNLSEIINVNLGIPNQRTAPAAQTALDRLMQRAKGAQTAREAAAQQPGGSG